MERSALENKEPREFRLVVVLLESRKQKLQEKALRLVGVKQKNELVTD